MAESRYEDLIPSLPEQDYLEDLADAVESAGLEQWRPVVSDALVKALTIEVFQLRKRLAELEAKASDG